MISHENRLVFTYDANTLDRAMGPKFSENSRNQVAFMPKQN